MVPRPELSPPARPAPPATGWPSLGGPTSAPRWPLAVALAAALFLVCPLTWDDSALPIWSPHVGFGLALVVWFGRRFGLGTLAVAGALIILRQLARLNEPNAQARLLWAACEAGLTVAEVAAAAWLFSD